MNRIAIVAVLALAGCSAEVQATPTGICCAYVGEIVTEPLADGGTTTDVGQDSLIVANCASIPPTCSPSADDGPTALRCRWTQASFLEASIHTVCFLTK
jgi:hypothetical protein